MTAAIHGGDLQLDRYAGPPGDPGLLAIAPGDPAWRVHGHPAGMMIGGFAALMLQSLHPLAMAGVDQYSDYRTDPIGRLNRTARFITTTTFGSRPAAEQAIAVVSRIHTHVHGTAPDGRRFRADDPELLTWVHTTEVRSFLTGYQVYAQRRLRLTDAECDTYYTQAAPVAEALGAMEVPRSVHAVEQYLDRMRPQLSVTPAALESIRFLRGFGRNRRERWVTHLLMSGSVGLLPAWARVQLGIHRPAAVRIAWDRPRATAVGRVLGWARGPSEIDAVARGRLAVAPGRDV
ncbi:oxygenase MpaB family protein [Actinospica sp.]|uniref:oxygenase MpaB family protein n=1 Tax=Actinospica sp. TaxID=1872142 RepID=UPI002D13D54D|nr:oxygenase MpaB family protein [Actinospica sp.]HWG28316.1 oxygenase MpaB family protein [Actinospica sp.]